MSEVNFGSGATPVDAAPTAEQDASKLPAQNTTTAVARPIQGDFIPAFRDVILPSLQIAHPVGEIGKTFVHGSLVYNARTPLYVPPDINLATGEVKRVATKPVNITFLGFEQPRFAEKVAGGARGIEVRTEQEVTAAGGTLDYNEWKLKQCKYFNPVVRAMVAIERPETIEDDGTVFVHEINGLKYTLAFWTLKAGAYTAVCKRVVFAAKLTGCLQRGYPTFSFAVSTKLNTYGANSAWMPVAVPNKASTPEFLEFTKAVLNG